jgi:hypothetical protein
VTRGDPIKIEQAAEALGVAPATVRRWVREGAPCIELGTAGRGKGSLVDLAELRRWRAGGALGERSDREQLEHLPRMLLDFWRRDSGLDGPAHRDLGISDRAAAAYLDVLFQYICRRLDQEPADLPPEIERLRSVWVSLGQSHTRNPR